MSAVPPALRTWFVIHCVVDLTFAVPLFVAPVATLRLFGWTAVDPLTTRLVAAALVGIGVESYLGRDAPREHFAGMLRLKVLWSLAANLGIFLSILQGAPATAWLFQAIFLGFSALWITYAVRLSRGRP
jgi:hypothetical protein